MNDFEKKVSIIVPVYNVEAYLRECLDGILNQSFKDFEVILVDDGSPDSCPAICDEYGKKDKRIVVIHQKNSGLSAARNNGIDIAKGEWITFVDSDDVVSADYLDTLFNLAENNGSQIAICGAWTIKNGERSEYAEAPEKTETMTTDKALERLLKYELQHNAWAKIYYSFLFRDIRFPIGRKFEDLATTHLLFNRAERITVSNHKCYGYRITDSSIMSYARTHIVKDKLDANDEIAVWLTENKPQLLKAHIEGCISSAVSDMFKIALAGTESDNKEFYAWTRAFLREYGKELTGYGKEKIFIDVFSRFPKMLRLYPSVIRNKKRA